MRLTAAAFTALVAGASAAEHTRKFTRAATPFQLGLHLRDTDTAYAPETTECGEGDSCTEACGDGYLECMANGVANHCYNPAAGETCCAYTGNGNSCEAGYFCAHNSESKTTCCSEGKSLEDCAKEHDVDALVSDPPTPTYTPAPKKSSSSTSTTESTTTASDASATKPAVVPSQTAAVVTPNAAGRVGAATGALLFVAGAFAALF